MPWPRVTASVWGEPKTGKSHLALSFPGPIKALEIGETGIEDLLWKFQDTKEVEYVPIVMRTMTPTIADHQRLLLEFEKQVRLAVDSTTLRTLVVDSASRLWRSIRIVKTEESFKENERKKRNQADYELANDYFEQIIQNVRLNRQLNLVLVHRHREKFAMIANESGGQSLQATGEMEARDYSGMENLVQVIIRTQLGTKFDPATKTQVAAMMHRLELCRFDNALNGTVIPNMTYPLLMERIFGKEVPVGTT